MSTPQHIGLNLIFLVPGETGGMEVAARELIPALIEEAPAGTRFTAFVNREAATAGGGPWGELLPMVTVPVHARNRPQWVLGEQLALPALAARARVDLVHSLASTAPLAGPFRRVVTIHDLIYARFPDAHAGLRDKGMRLLVPAAARRSHRVIVDSESTRKDLVELVRIPAERIDVVPLGLGAVRREQPLPPAELRARLELAERSVLLTLSAKRPHKNLLALLGALAAIPAERRPLLVAPGYPTAHEQELRARAAALAIERDIRFPGVAVRCRTRGAVGDGASLRVPLLVRGLRAAGARGDGAWSARGLLARVLTSGGRGRRRAPVRPAFGARDARGDRAAARRRRARRAAARARHRPRRRVHVAAHGPPDARELRARFG